jgi:hypothetical protein
MNEHARCPFCGWYEIVEDSQIKIGEESVCICLHCQAIVPASIWDCRIIEDELQAKIEELSEIIHDIHNSTR